MLEKRIVTGDIALEYLTNELEKGLTLSSFIGELSLGQGVIYAFVPGGTSEEKLYNFEVGGLYFGEELLKEQNASVPIRNEARPILVNEIENYISLSENNCCLFEDATRRPSDSTVVKSNMEYVHLNNGEMFYFFDGRNNYADGIKKALVTSESYVFLCAMSSLGVTMRDDFFLHKEISLDLLQRFAAGVTSFFVKAYDYEGYLMWVKKE